MDIIDDIYYSMLGQIVPEESISWVENAFSAGSNCEENLIKIYAARDRLLERLGICEEDEDLECILDSFLTNQYILCRKMFFYGLHYREDVLLSCTEQESNQRSRLRGRR